MCAGIRCPNDTTTPKSYLTLVLLSVKNECQSQHSKCRFCSVYFLIGFPLALNDVTTSNRWIFELLHFLLRKNEKILHSMDAFKTINTNKFVTVNYPIITDFLMKIDLYRRITHSILIVYHNWLNKNESTDFDGQTMISISFCI